MKSPWIALYTYALMNSAYRLNAEITGVCYTFLAEKCGAAKMKYVAAADALPRVRVVRLASPVGMPFARLAKCVVSGY